MSAHVIPPKLRVLIVEDSIVNQKFLSLLLGSQGYEVTVADNGQVAVDKFAEEKFDLVLMDVQMPVMDGLTATRMIRQQEQGTDQHVLIVAVTAGFDRETCLEAGMDDHLQKPVRPPILRSVLEQLTGEMSI